MKTIIFGCLLAVHSSLLNASELIYTPVNPAFGGHPNNGPYLLNNAQAQNDHDEDKPSLPGDSPLERFTSSLESRVLNDLLKDVGKGETGSLLTPDFEVEITNSDAGLIVTTIDRKTGQRKQIIVKGLDPSTL